MPRSPPLKHTTARTLFSSTYHRYCCNRVWQLFIHRDVRREAEAVLESLKGCKSVEVRKHLEKTLSGFLCAPNFKCDEKKWSTAFDESTRHAVLSYLCENVDYMYPQFSDKVPHGQTSCICSESVLLGHRFCVSYAFSFMSITSKSLHAKSWTIKVLQLTASPWTTEASTRERWQFGALTNRKATSSNKDQSLTSLYYY